MFYAIAVADLPRGQGQTLVFVWLFPIKSYACLCPHGSYVLCSHKQYLLHDSCIIRIRMKLGQLSGTISGEAALLSTQVAIIYHVDP